MPVPLRVLELLVSTGPGGGPAHVRDLLEGLPREEFAITVGAPPGGPYEAEFRSLGADFEPVRADRLSPAVLARVIAVARRRRAQIIHSHGKGAGLYGRIAAPLVGAAAVHTFHGVHHEAYPRLYLQLERALARGSFAVIHVSASQAREAAALGLTPPGRTRVIVNGIDAGRVQATAARAPLTPAAVGLEPGAPVLGTVARLDPVKALDVLLRAFARLGARVPGARLLIVGDGPEGPRLRALARELGVDGRVMFAGFRADAVRWLPLMDVFASASRREGLPLAMLEAMACERPVVATRVPGHEDAVEHGETGVLVTADDPDALAAAAAGLLTDAPRRAALGAAGRRRVESRFTRARMVAEVADLYHEAGGFPRRAAAGRGV
jgi:glycosyltransferase involved in cell wall biosynthesis